MDKGFRIDDTGVAGTIAEVNNQGADCYDQGDFRSALRCFRYSLELCLTKCRNGTSSTVGSPSPCLPTKKPMLPSSSASPGFSKRDGSSRETSAPQHNFATDDNVPFVYHKSIFRMPLEACPLYHSVTDEKKDRWRAAISVFNCAMVFQQLQASSCSMGDASRRNHLEKSLTLYKQALSLLEDRYDGQMETTGHPIIDLLWMASINNVAIILSCEMFRYTEAQEFLHHLLSRTKAFQATKCYTHECDDESTSFAMTMEKHVDTFLLNSVTLLFGGPIVTAVAA